MKFSLLHHKCDPLLADGPCTRVVLHVGSATWGHRYISRDGNMLIHTSIYAFTYISTTYLLYLLYLFWAVCRLLTLRISYQNVHKTDTSSPGPLIFVTSQLQFNVCPDIRWHAHVFRIKFERSV